MKRRISPAIALMILAPVIGELLTGSSPPAEFFGPFGLWALPLMYGCGALLVREAVFRWKKGWASLLLLGAAYGIAEEGLACKSFFDPNWVDIGALGSFGRWGGINWLWTEQLIVFHAVASISTSILIVTLLYPEKKDEPWLGRKGLYHAAAGFVFIEVLCFGLLTAYNPGVPLVLSSLATIGVLVYAAYRMPHPAPWEKYLALPTAFREWLGKPMRRVPSSENVQVPARKYFFSGLAYILGFYLVPSIAQGLGAPAPVTGLVLMLFFLLIGMRIVWLSGFGNNWSDTQKLALLAGGLSFFIFLCPVMELANPARPDDTTGMTAVGIAFCAFLLWLYWRVGKRANAGRQDRQQQPAAA